MNLCIVGSSLNGLGTTSSDVDMCILLPNHTTEIDQSRDAVPILKYVMSQISDLGSLKFLIFTFQFFISNLPNINFYFFWKIFINYSRKIIKILLQLI